MTAGLWKGTFIILAAAALFLLPATLHVRAQTSSPQLLITWRTDGSYVPPFYFGKPLPGPNSKITASVELLSQGKFVSLKGETIYWYLNGNYLGGGVGAQHITFTPYGGAPDAISLQVKIPNYPGVPLHEITIPIVRPKIVVDAPYLGGSFVGGAAIVKVFPYFFSIADPFSLSYSWSVNGSPAISGESPDIAQIVVPSGAPAGSTFGVVVNVTNQKAAEAANGFVHLIYGGQL